MKIKNFHKSSRRKISENLAYIAGALRDGSLPKPYNNQYEIQLSQKNLNWLEMVKNILQELFPEKNIRIVKYGKQTPRIKIYSKMIYKDLVELFEYPGTQNKCKVLEQIKDILEKDFDIKCGNVSGPKKEKKFPSFDLAIYGNNVNKFFEEIGTLHPRHKERLKLMFGDTTTQSLAV